MLIKKEKIEDLEFMDVEPEDEELRSIVMEEEDKAKKKAEEEYDFEVMRAEKQRLKEALKRVEVSGGFQGSWRLNRRNQMSSWFTGISSVKSNTWNFFDSGKTWGGVELNGNKF